MPRSRAGRVGLLRDWLEFRGHRLGLRERWLGYRGTGSDFGSSCAESGRNGADAAGIASMLEKRLILRQLAPPVRGRAEEMRFLDARADNARIPRQHFEKCRRRALLGPQYDEIDRRVVRTSSSQVRLKGHRERIYVNMASQYWTAGSHACASSAQSTAGICMKADINARMPVVPLILVRISTHPTMDASRADVRTVARCAILRSHLNVNGVHNVAVLEQRSSRSVGAVDPPARYRSTRKRVL